MTEKHLTLTAGNFTVDAARQDGQPSRSITGLAVPWNVATTDSLGTKVMFMPGSLPEQGRPPRLLEGHDTSKVRGIVTERVNTSEGMMFTAKLAETRDANDTMALLLMGAYDSVSVGVVPTKFSFDNDGTMVVEEGRWTELSIVAEPAFEQARIEKVAASSPEDDTPDEPEETQTPEPEEDSMSEPTPVEASAPAIIPTVPLYAEPRREFKMPTPGEWISAAVEGGSRFAELQAKIKAAAPDVTTGDLDGVMPIPVLGPVYNNFRGMRPIVDAIGARAMPQGGKVFIRPVVTTHTSIGTVTQGQTIQDGTFVVNDVQITKAIYGGYVELSEASIDWSSPEVLGALVDDMARIYANETDAVAATELATESANNTENFTVADIADPTEWARWMYAAAENILTGSNGNLPTHLFLSPLRWSQLGQLVDGQQRPLFPQAGPMNAFGSVAPGQYVGNAFGFAVVVDRNLTDEMIVGHPDGFECYEQQKGVVSIENPSLLARTIAFRGYFAPKMIDGSKFVRAAFV